jgi:hypothetical protein
MALDTYANLKTAIADWLNRSDLGTVVDDFIDAAEAKFKRNEALWEEIETYYGPIEITSPENVAYHRDRWNGASGVPKYAALTQDGSAVMFAPEPDTTYNLTIHYRRAIDSLGASQTTNWLLTNHPDVYLYGSLVESAAYLREDERLPMWERKLATAIEDVRLLKDRQRFGGGPLVARPRRALGE